MLDDHPAEEVTAEELVEAINESDAELTSSFDFNAAELITVDFNDIFEPMREIQREQARALLEPIQEFHRQQAEALTEPFEEVARMQAEMVTKDLPDEVFSTAIAASTVSTRTRTSPSPSTQYDTEPASTPTYNDVDVEVPKSLYLNTAYTLAQYIVSRIDGLNQQQRGAAIILIGAGIAAGAARHSQVSETPLVASTSVITFGMLLQLLLGTEDQQ